MKQLVVPFSPYLFRDSSPQEASDCLDQLPKNQIDTVPWPKFNYKPEVKFTLAHSNNCLFIKFYVQEQSVRTVFRKTNDPVYKDSCVEFFIAFNDEPAYYNLEVNSLGTCLLGFGTGKTNRKLAAVTCVEKIKHAASLAIQRTADGKPIVKWELTLLIPAEVFCFHQLTSFYGQNCRVNFYKCGDDSPTPHFLAWNKIETTEPDFHMPAYFGAMQFS